jgi:hypothetical protein
MDFSTIASVVSAVGGLVACVAAFESAKHAKNTFDAAQLSEKRLSLRQLSLIADEVIIEVDRIKWVAVGLKVAYQTLFTFSGGSGTNSRQPIYTQGVDEKIEEAEQLLIKAKPFTTFQTTLLNGPIEEISSREVSIAQCLARAKAIRERLEVEHHSIEAQNQAHRERVFNK